MGRGLLHGVTGIRSVGAATVSPAGGRLRLLVGSQLESRADAGLRRSGGGADDGERWKAALVEKGWR